MELLEITGPDGDHHGITSSRDRDHSLRVQVPNNHILTPNLYYNYYYPNPKYVIIGYMDPPGFRVLGRRYCSPKSELLIIPGYMTRSRAGVSKKKRPKLKLRMEGFQKIGVPFGGPSTTKINVLWGPWWGPSVMEGTASHLGESQYASGAVVYFRRHDLGRG